MLFFFKIRFVVHGLTTGENYIFRVKAANAVGVSENSQESEPITVQAALSKCGSGQLCFAFILWVKILVPTNSYGLI